MTDQVATKGAKKGRKFARSKRGHSMMTYNAVGRDKINKAKKIARHEASVEKKNDRYFRGLIVLRGTARATRRGNPCALLGGGSSV